MLSNVRDADGESPERGVCGRVDRLGVDRCENNDNKIAEMDDEVIHQKSHHCNTSVFYFVQNLFPRWRHNRIISSQTKYIVLLKTFKLPFLATSLRVCIRTTRLRTCTQTTRLWRCSRTKRLRRCTRTTLLRVCTRTTPLRVCTRTTRLRRCTGQHF